ncbi:hypothetical protein F4804DRAFT_349712 [Jackrogersella minutella]|nr:hypothetical protein F4804DRAFT_349712 [Jackrogersella minutella]
MSCGHVLTHYTQRCDMGRSLPCPKPSLDSPRAYLSDTCARCDPEFNRNKLSREQIKRHDELVDQLYTSKLVGRPDEARKLLDGMEYLRRSTSNAIGAMQSLRLTSAFGDVEFPGSNSEPIMPRYTSKWVNGKCVWEEEQATWKPGSSRVKRAHSTTTPPIKTGAKVEKISEEEVQPLVSGPPRLRSTKKGYTNHLPEEKEQSVISGPPRLRTNKPYSGPRTNVVAFDIETEEHKAPQLQPQHSLRRTKRRTGRLDNSYCSDQESVVTVKYVGKDSGSGGTVMRAKQSRHVTPEGDSDDEDMWLQLAEKQTPVNAIGNGPLRSFRDRMSSK